MSTVTELIFDPTVLYFERKTLKKETPLEYSFHLADLSVLLCEAPYVSVKKDVLVIQNTTTNKFAFKVRRLTHTENEHH
jgi:hypothetical protein